MTEDQSLIFGILLLTLLFFIWGRWRYDLVAVMALLAATIVGVVPWNEAFSGFAHPAVITVASILIISRALLKSGLVDAIYRILSRASDSPQRQVMSLTGIVAILSSFMNNVGALAILLPVGLRMARRAKNPPSIFLMPLAFGSLLGGLVTLIGTPPNIIVAGFRAENLGEPFQMFDFAPVGAGVLLAGLLFIWLVGWKMTPKRRPPSRGELFTIENYITEIWVTNRSRLAGRPLRELKEAAISELQILGLVRDHLRIPKPSGDEILQPGDILAVQSDAENLEILMEWARLNPVERERTVKRSLLSREVGLMEAVVMKDSPLVGESASSLCMRQRFGVNLIAIARRGETIWERLSKMSFQPGDVLLLQGLSGPMPEILQSMGCLPLAERNMRLERMPRQPMLPLAIFAAAILLAAYGLLPVHIAFTGAAAGMVLAGILSLRETYDSVDWPIIVLIGALIPVGAALESTGGAELISSALLQTFGDFPAAVILAILLAWTMILTNIVNNAAAAVIMSPIALSTAQFWGLSPDPFLMAVAIGASCAFLTPIGHQSNALVMGPGGYKFGDYWRLGLPLSAVAVLAAIPLLLWFWPLEPGGL